MKLRNKIILTFGGTVLASVMVVGTFAYFATSRLTMQSIGQGIGTSSKLAAEQIAGKIEDFMNITAVSGRDYIISTSKSNEVKSNRIDQMAEAYGFSSGNILDANGISIKDGTDFSDREYVKEALAGKVNISDITLSKYTNTYGFSVASPTTDLVGYINGVLYYRMDIDFMTRIIDEINISDNSYAYIINEKGTVIVHKDESLINEMNLEQEGGALAKLYQQMKISENGTGEYKINQENMLCGYSIDQRYEWLGTGGGSTGNRFYKGNWK